MARTEYHMSAADLRTFDRWHAYGAAILLAALLLMPWVLDAGPNSWRETPAADPATRDAGRADRPG